MRYYIEQSVRDPSPGLRIIERNPDGSETVIWYLQTQHSHLILQEIRGDYLLLGDWDGKFSRFHIPSQTLTHTQRLAGEVSIGAVVSSGGFTIMVTMNNENDYNLPTLVRLDCNNLSILSDFRLPFELNNEDDEEDEDSELDTDEEFEPQIDCYKLDVYRPREPIAGQLWLYACNTNSSWDKPKPHEFYRLDMLAQQESLLALPGVGNADNELCMPALNFAANLGVMLSWDAAPMIAQSAEHNGEPAIQLQLELFDIEQCEIIRKLPLRCYSFEQLQNFRVDIDVLQEGPDEDAEQYFEELSDLYKELKDMCWQDDKLLLTFEDQSLLLDINGHAEPFTAASKAANSHPDIKRSYLPEAILAEQLAGCHLIKTDDIPQAMQQMLALCKDVGSARYGNRFSFALVDNAGNRVEPTAFYQQAVQQHAEVMQEMVTAYCDYLDTTRLKNNLWERDYCTGSLCHVVYALVSTGDEAKLPLIDRFISYIDPDHESFVRDDLLPKLAVVFDENLPLVQNIRGWYEDDWEDDWQQE
ncbi:hypothetical protein MSG37_14500 [Shewanella sp. 1CM18E]|uniref:hypothetical protein n=1 Tax=Shewanella sp. 1CM18E TaxID=2929169 RepID=UPI0020C15891|nr:hypothetical protein [Shewanella sp. 1CM18E]MCK8046092.1 hypothetical protein [Shewanella sp. 1CM18E]